MSKKAAKIPSAALGIFGEPRNQGYGPGEADYITWPAARKRNVPGPLFDLPPDMHPKEAESLFFPPKPAWYPQDTGSPNPNVPDTGGDPYAIVMQLAQMLKGMG